MVSEEKNVKSLKIRDAVYLGKKDLAGVDLQVVI